MERGTYCLWVVLDVVRHVLDCTPCIELAVEQCLGLLQACQLKRCDSFLLWKPTHRVLCLGRLGLLPLLPPLPHLVPFAPVGQYTPGLVHPNQLLLVLAGRAALYPPGLPPPLVLLSLTPSQIPPEFVTSSPALLRPNSTSVFFRCQTWPRMLIRSTSQRNTPRSLHLLSCRQ